MSELSNKFPENQKSPERLNNDITRKEFMDYIKKDLEEKVKAGIITEEKRQEIICTYQANCEKINNETGESIAKMQIKELFKKIIHAAENNNGTILELTTLEKELLESLDKQMQDTSIDDGTKKIRLTGEEFKGIDKDMKKKALFEKLVNAAESNNGIYLELTEDEKALWEELNKQMQDTSINIEEGEDKTYEIEKDWQEFDAKFTEREILFNYKLPRFEGLKGKGIKYATLPHPSLVFGKSVKFDAKNLTLTGLIKKKPGDYNFTIIAYKGNEVLARRIGTITIESRDAETAGPYLYDNFDLDLYSNTSYESGYRLPKITDSTKNVEYKFDGLEILGKGVRYDEKRHELVGIIDCKPGEYLIGVTITDKNTGEVYKKTPLVTVGKLPDFVKQPKR